MYGAPIIYHSFELEVFHITSEPAGGFVSSEAFFSVSLTVHTWFLSFILKSLAHNLLFSF